MKKLLMILAGLMVLVSFTMCTTLHSVSLTQVPRDRDDKIHTKVTDWGILGIFGSNKLVDKARQQLEDECRSGKITGILTKYADYNYLLVVKREITVHAVCQKY